VAYKQDFGWSAHQEVVASNAIGTIADFDSGYPQPLDSVSVPEPDAGNQRNGFIDGQFFENLGQVRLCEVRGGHLRKVGTGFLGPIGTRWAYIPARQGLLTRGTARAAQRNGKLAEVSPCPNLEPMLACGINAIVG